MTSVDEEPILHSEVAIGLKPAPSAVVPRFSGYPDPPAFSGVWFLVIWVSTSTKPEIEAVDAVAELLLDLIPLGFAGDGC